MSAWPNVFGSALNALITTVALLYNTRWLSQREPTEELRQDQRKAYLDFLNQMHALLTGFPASTLAEAEANASGEPFDPLEHMPDIVLLDQSARRLWLIATRATRREADELRGRFAEFVMSIDPEQPILGLDSALDNARDGYDELVDLMRRDLGAVH